mgnify:CR=1 FL=1
MNRDGFISVFALLMMSLVLAIGMYVMYSVTIQTYIVNNYRRDIQSKITVDSSINTILYDEANFEDKLLPEIYYILRNKVPPYFTEVDANDIPIPLGRKVNLSMFPNIEYASLHLEGLKAFRIKKDKDIPDNYDELTNLILRIDTKHEDSKDKIMVKGKVFNKIFEIEEAYITEARMSEYGLLDEYHDLMDTFENEIVEHDPKGNVSFLKFNLYGDGFIDSNNITEILNGFQNSYQHRGKHIMINIISQDDKRPIWHIKSSALMRIRGNIYCEGDLIIDSPLLLEGNLILNGGRLIIAEDFNYDNYPVPIEIGGKVFSRGEECLNFEDIKIKPYKKHIYRYGSYLPGFLDISFDVIKR